MAPWAIMLFSTAATSVGWHPVSPQVTRATRRSPGLTKRTKSQLSLSQSAWDSSGFAELAKRWVLCGSTWAAFFWASYSASPAFFPAGAVGPASPPWQSVHPMLTDDSCMVLESVWVWQETQPALFFATSWSDCFFRSPALVARSATLGTGARGARAQATMTSATSTAESPQPTAARPRPPRVAALSMAFLSVGPGGRGALHPRVPLRGHASSAAGVGSLTVPQYVTVKVANAE